MAPALDMLHVASPALAGLLVASIWQGVLLTGIIALCLRLVPDVPAGTKSVIWTAVLVLIVLLPVISVSLPHVSMDRGGAVQLANDWSLGLVCLWAILSVFRGAELCVSAVRLWTLARSAQPIEVDAAMASLLETGSRRVALCTSDHVDRPSVVGFFRPRILLSRDVLRNLSRPELEQIVLHEMEHLRRGDHWTNLLQQLSLVLLPWNPAVLWLNRRLCFERELACDDGVLRATKARKTYAACLVRLAESSMLRRGISLAVGALGAFEPRARDSELLRRVRRILATPEPGRRPQFLRAAATAMLAGALALSVLLARSPRLVEFGKTPVTIAAAGSSEPQTLTRALHVDRTDAAQPVLVKAIVSGPKIARGFETPATFHKHLVVRHHAVRAEETTRQIAVPVWRDPVPIARRVIAWTSADDSQNVYAAVPVQGGWLLIQL